MSKGNHLVVHKRAEDGQIFHDEDCPKCTGNSPPPVAGDFREEIDKLLEEAETHEWQATHSLEDLRDSILTILNECRRPPLGGK